MKHNHFVLPAILALLALSVQESSAQSDTRGWSTFTDANGTRLPYPRDLLPIEAGEDEPKGPVFVSPDRRARLHIFAAGNKLNESPRQFLRGRFPKDRVSALTYVRIARDFFVISEPKDGKALYMRCNFPNNRVVHCFDIRYPLNEKKAWDSIVTRMSSSLRPR